MALFTAGSAARPDLTPEHRDFAATDLDILRWKGRPRFKGRDRVLGELAAAMSRRVGWQGRSDAVGLLTHHLDHDAGRLAVSGLVPQLGWGRLPLGGYRRRRAAPAPNQEAVGHDTGLSLAGRVYHGPGRQKSAR